MDVFGTVVMAGTLILNFLSSCRDFGPDARHLEANFAWDLAAITAIHQYFQKRKAQGDDAGLPEDQQLLLERTSQYLEELVNDMHRSLRKLNRVGLATSVFNHAMWIQRKGAIGDMQKELNEWTKRFDVRVLALPLELRAVIPSTTPSRRGANAFPPAMVRSHQRMERFIVLNPANRKKLAADMLLTESADLARQITRWEKEISSLPLSIGGESLVFAARRLPEGIKPGHPRYDGLLRDMGEFAAQLNQLEPEAAVRLLKVHNYFYHARSNQFLFSHHPPYPTRAMKTLGDVIKLDSAFFPDITVALNHRLQLAYKLSEAVFFLHTARSPCGFLHKNITLSSVVVFEPTSPTQLVTAQDDYPTPARKTEPLVDGAYLMGFDLIRGADAYTAKQGVTRADGTPTSIWDFDVYQHPDRLQGPQSPRYIKTYDIYSLGVVLLQIGLWQPLAEAAPELAGSDKASWAYQMLELVPALAPRVGERYAGLVEWCLSLSGDEVTRDEEFIERVLDPLDNMAKALQVG